MAVQIATNKTATGIAYALGTADSFYSPVGTSVVSTDDTGVFAQGSFQKALISGSIFGASQGVFFGDSPAIDKSSVIKVTATGSVDSLIVGMALWGGDFRLFNNGSIFGQTIGLAVRSSGIDGEETVIVNRGIIAGDIGIDVQSGEAIISNFGTIAGSDNSYSAIIGGALGDLITNRGTIIGKVILGLGTDTLTNRGSISGNVSTSDGDDRIDNRGSFIGGRVDTGSGDDLVDNRGGTIDGEVDLGSFNDRFVAGAGKETVFGGTGTDTVDFRNSSGVKVALDASIVATGWASDDFYIGFENIVGSVTGRNVLIGNGSNNQLVGGEAKDTLNGMAGADSLFGGSGDDILLGGTGDDEFYGDDGKDSITGGEGRDIVYGNKGADVFVFAPGDFGGAGPNTADFIGDFAQSERDKINIVLIDAKDSTARDNAFTFIGSNLFSKVQGQLRYEFVGDNTLVLGDTNGDGIADFAINLAGNITLLATDFVL